jgi:hypothetical protein
MLARLGSALILIGLVAMVVYLVSSTIGQGDPTVLLAGAATALAGLILHRRGLAQTPPASGRFSTLRRMMGQDSEQDDADLE